MEKILELMEIVSRPNYDSDYSNAKAARACIRCRRPAREFRDGCSRLEYSVSALCQACQDEIFLKGGALPGDGTLPWQAKGMGDDLS